MTTVDSFVADSREAVQAQVPDEQVLAVGILGESATFPQEVVAAVTPRRILFFGFAPTATSIEVTRRMGEVSRRGLRVTGVGRAVVTRVTFHLADDTTLEFDSNHLAGRYRRLNEAFLTELAAGDVTPQR